MRKFIMSDIHGFGNVYYSMMNYLDNINKNEEIELYINGDLIDRGYESAEILLDIKKRIEDNKFKIVYLGGNHELMMHEFYEELREGHFNYHNNWYYNGGYITDDSLFETLNNKEKVLEVVKFVSNLKIYHKFKEKIGNKKIVLVHAACPLIVKNRCDLFINSNTREVFNYVWTRQDYESMRFCEHVGNKHYFTIIGHTPNNNPYGFEYNSLENYLNIDGGCASYVSGFFDYNHFPLVEVCNNYLKILTFNSDNEIIYGNYFDGVNIIPYKEEELDKEREYLNKNLKTKKLAINEDNIVYYINE